MRITLKALQKNPSLIGIRKFLAQIPADRWGRGWYYTKGKRKTAPYHLGAPPEGVVNRAYQFESILPRSELLKANNGEMISETGFLTWPTKNPGREIKKRVLSYIDMVIEAGVQPKEKGWTRIIGYTHDSWRHDSGAKVWCHYKKGDPRPNLCSIPKEVRPYYTRLGFFKTLWRAKAHALKIHHETNQSHT